MNTLLSFLTRPLHTRSHMTIACFGLALCMLLPVPGSAQGADSWPFAPGERLHFVLKWANIPAGRAMLEVAQMDDSLGQPAHHLVMTARTNSFVDVFFKVRDRIDAWVDQDFGGGLFFKKKQREGSYKKDVELVFDWDRLKAIRTSNGDQKEPITILPGTFDVLSIFYRFRFLPLAEGKRIMTPVTDGKKFVLGEATVIRRETVSVPAGEFDTYLVEPDLKHLGGVFKKSKNAKLQVWVTADERRIPVLVRSKVVVGHFTVELEAIERAGEPVVGTLPPTK